MRKGLCLAIWPALMLAAVHAAELKVGDKAPKLQVSKWVQGEPVQNFKEGTAYIVEFWATWCPPCRESIPHLNEIHKKFQDKGLVVIGMDCWERDQAAVEPFVKKMGEKMTYRVALDTAPGDAGKMAQTWMKAAGQDGIPAAFVINKHGLIAWIGHPMELKESTIEQILSDTFDVKKAAADFEKHIKIEEETRGLWADLRGQMNEKNWDAAEATLNKLEKILPEDERVGVDMTRFHMLVNRKDYPAAMALASKLSDAHTENPMLQNALAWEIATGKGIENRDLKLAEKIARRANDAAKGKNAAVLDTLARVLFLKGDKEAALKLQEEAVAASEGPMRDELNRTLLSYRDGKEPVAE